MTVAWRYPALRHPALRFGGQLEGELNPPGGEPGWVDSGATAGSYLFSSVLRVSNTAPFSISDRIRINGAEATIDGIVSPGVNGAIQLSTVIPISGGEAIEIWQ